MVSLVQPLQGGMIEVAMIGKEGFVGVPVLLGTDTSPLEAMVQIPGSALRIETSAFREQMGRSTALSSVLLRSAQALQVQASVSAACNGRHPLLERLARWLLMARDRAPGDELPLGHEFLSMMLGVRRAGVTVALGTLKAAGLVCKTSRPRHDHRPPRLGSGLLRVLPHRYGRVRASVSYRRGGSYRSPSASFRRLDAFCSDA